MNNLQFLYPIMLKMSDSIIRSLNWNKCVILEEGLNDFAQIQNTYTAPSKSIGTARPILWYIRFVIRWRRLGLGSKDVHETVRIPGFISCYLHLEEVTFGDRAPMIRLIKL